LISRLTREKEILTLGRKIQTEAKDKMSKAQREYYLREQLRAIKKELGETVDDDEETADYAEKIKIAELPEEARREAQREL
jgi:ATP-dependent Lon protease